MSNRRQTVPRCFIKAGFVPRPVRRKTWSCAQIGAFQGRSRSEKRNASPASISTRESNRPSRRRHVARKLWIGCSTRWRWTLAVGPNDGEGRSRPAAGDVGCALEAADVSTLGRTDRASQSPACDRSDDPVSGDALSPTAIVLSGSRWYPLGRSLRSLFRLAHVLPLLAHLVAVPALARRRAPGVSGRCSIVWWTPRARAAERRRRTRGSALQFLQRPRRSSQTDVRPAWSVLVSSWRSASFMPGRALGAFGRIR